MGKINFLGIWISVLMVVLLTYCKMTSPRMGDRVILERRPTDTLMIVGGKFKEGVFHYTVRYVRKNGTWYEYEVSKHENILIVR